MWKNTQQSTFFQESLDATDSIQPPAVGFTSIDSKTNPVFTSLVKQNNLILQQLYQIYTKLEEVCEQNKQLLKQKGVVTSQLDTEVTGPLKDLLKNFEQNLKLQAEDSKTKKVPASSQRLYVFKDPQQIFDEVKAKEARKK